MIVHVLICLDKSLLFLQLHKERIHQDMIIRSLKFYIREYIQMVNEAHLVCSEIFPKQIPSYIR